MPRGTDRPGRRPSKAGDAAKGKRKDRSPGHGAGRPRSSGTSTETPERRKKEPRNPGSRTSERPEKGTSNSQTQSQKRPAGNPPRRGKAGPTANGPHRPGRDGGPRPPEKPRPKSASGPAGPGRNGFLYQKNGRYFAQVPGGMEELAAEEILALGGRNAEPTVRGVHFDAKPAAVYAVTYGARLATRVLAPLLAFPCPNSDVLYQKAHTLPWNSLLRTDETFAVVANVARSAVTHSQFAALRVKDAVADRFQERIGKRPSVDRRDPDLWINLHIHEDTATISLDLSGGSLHKRGYRREGLEAPMQETLAAAIIRLAEWDGDRPIHDPMCGSGTLLCEAAMEYCRVPAGHLREKFGFERLPDFDPILWKAVRQRMDEDIRPLPGDLIFGGDSDGKAVAVARANLKQLPGGEKVTLRRARFQELEGLQDCVIVANPPYGVRMGDGDPGEPITELGDFLKQRCQGSTAYLYFGDRELIKKVGLKPAWKKPLRNGGLDGRLVKYELY
ncbi:MAG: class I SAM-dependent RNA methyltransferase [Desulfococcaceae bacterium]